LVLPVSPTYSIVQAASPDSDGEIHGEL